MAALILVTVGALGALILVFGISLALHSTAARRVSFVHWVMPSILIGSAGAALLTGRSVTSVYVEGPILLNSGTSGALSWVYRVTTVVILLACSERFLSWLVGTRKVVGMRWPQLLGFLFFWLLTVLVPSFWGAVPHFQHDYVYSLVLCSAVLVLDDDDVDRVMLWFRNAMVVFVVCSFLAIAVNTSAVLDVAYKQGFLPGVPRMAGLASHAVTFGMLVTTGMVVLWAYPFERRWLNRMVWALFGVAELLAQSKTMWLILFMCSVFVWVFVPRNHLDILLTRKGVPVKGLALLVLLMILLSALAWAVMFGGVGQVVDRLMDSKDAAQLTSLTGRDQIWAVAIEEWERNPLFGYGMTLWELPYRMSIGMLNATSAHNQFFDTLSRAGVVGVVGLVILTVILVWAGTRHVRAFRGLNLALLVMVLMQGISETPLTMMGYAPAAIPAVLLLIHSCRQKPAEPGHERAP